MEWLTSHSSVSEGYVPVDKSLLFFYFSSIIIIISLTTFIIFIIGYRFSQKARNRWFVAYTLMKNPSLRQLKSNNYQNIDYHSLVVNVDNQANGVPCSLNPVFNES